jgi:hypothetical protein
MIDFNTYQELLALSFTWAEAYDFKNWSLLRTILGDELIIDYSNIFGGTPKKMNCDDFVSFMSRQDLLGRENVKTHHFLGAHKFESSGDKIIGFYQIRAFHAKMKGEVCTKEAVGSNILEHTYAKIGDQWKIVGIKPGPLIYLIGDIQSLFED